MNAAPRTVNRHLVLFNVVLLTFMATLDGSIVNVALPNMAQKLSVGTEYIAWVVTSYLIAVSAAILIFGRLGDLKGMTNVFRWGVLIFTVGSLMCGLSNSFVLLIISRVIQAIGAAAFMSTSQGIITQTFPLSERGKALGLTGTFVALGSMAGPPLGGLIIQYFQWNYIFLINIPIGIFAFVMSLRTFPPVVRKEAERFDFLGAVFYVLTIVFLFGALIFSEERGLGDGLVLTGFGLAVALFVAFLLAETKQEHPLLNLRIFQNSLFSLSIFCGFLSFICISIASIVQPFYYQNVLHYSPRSAGLIMIIFPVILSVVAPISGYISDKKGSELLTLIGLALTSIGLYLFSTLTAESSLGLIIVYIAIMSVGNGLFQSPNNSLVMSSVTRDKLGVAGSVNALIRNLGMVFGISLSTILLYQLISDRLGYRVFNLVPGQNNAFIYGMRGVYIVGAAISALGAVLTAYRLIAHRRKGDA